MKIGITGATGQLGRLVVEKLKEKTGKDTIIALVRNTEKGADLGVELRAFDYESPSAEALSGLDKLLLISGNEIGKRFEQHAKVIEAAKQAGVPFMVYTSLLKADSSTLSLAAEHLDTEKTLASSGIPYCILRNGWYTENLTGSLAETIAQGNLYGSAGDGKTSSATREDYAEAAAVVLTEDGHIGKVYELAGDESFTMDEFALELSKVSGKPVVYVNLPVADYVAALQSAGIPEFWAQFYGGTHVSTQRGDLFDNGHRLSKLIGRPTTSLLRVLTETLSK